MSKTKSQSKEQILKKNGFKYHFMRMIYFNKKNKKVFSFEAIDDNDESWIIERIEEKNKNWIFYFNYPLPSNEIKEEIIKELEQ